MGPSRIAINRFEGESPGGILATVHCINPEYGFLLHQREKSGPYILKEIHTKSADEVEVAENFRGQVDGFMLAAYCVNNTPLSAILTDPSVSVLDAQAVSSASDGSQGQIEIVFDDQPAESRTALSGIVRLRPDRGWRVESFRNVTKKQPPDRPKLWYRSGALEYADESLSGLQVPKAIHVFKSETLDSAPVPLYDVEFLEVAKDDVHAGLFKLSQYGISEPLLATPGRRTNWFMAWCAVGAAIAFVLAVWIRRRSAAQT
jgi:hypothetical protein